MSNQEQNISCQNCAATLTFMPGSNSLVCIYCGHENQVTGVNDHFTQVQEFDIEAYEQEVFNQEEQIQSAVVKCSGCAAETTLGEKLTSKNCPFCSTPLVIKQAQVKRLHKPHYLLPFAISEKQAGVAFQLWIKKLWFAPNSLKRYARSRDRLQGMYLPFWTYDCFAHSYYRGERGEEYTVWIKNAKGESISQVRVRWYPAGGKVHNVFDDVLVPATRSLPVAKLDQLEPWDLHHLQPYNEQYLHGFKTENYQLTLRQGYQQAKQKMNSVIRQTIERDIGGDRQRIHSVNTEYKEATFKHILLPTWVSAYRFKHETFQFIVNARTAEVQGERPYSWPKIGLLVCAVLLLVYFIATTDWVMLKAQLLDWFR